ncbi:ArpU family phage packaging/lysis transcriptional regulator [Lactiplantibacillus modestisalitolerans]|uniref:ArpU family phage packaging/lysis transcriptional regulator n=1 Tax=Lactiplantibacillus modestisalitolerans TaxID=1457219 RepID=A0ABV5WVD9_9LACO|nr:ArpU family phage packaging/lysis transcriptional regulator [Lactiplantibacillus modestisalitolerans]
MESIFKGVDEDRTAIKAERVLKGYRKWLLRARKVNFNLQSPAMDGMPKSTSYRNPIEAKHVNKWNAEFMAKLVVNVIKGIVIDEKTEIYSELLMLFYIKNYSKTKCMITLNISDKTFNKYLKQAQLTFAEVYPDKVENLLVKKYEPEVVEHYDED